MGWREALRSARLTANSPFWVTSGNKTVHQSKGRQRKCDDRNSGNKTAQPKRWKADPQLLAPAIAGSATSCGWGASMKGCSLTLKIRPASIRYVVIPVEMRMGRRHVGKSAFVWNSHYSIPTTFSPTQGRPTLTFQFSHIELCPSAKRATRHAGGTNELSVLRSSRV